MYCVHENVLFGHLRRDNRHGVLPREIGGVEHFWQDEVGLYQVNIFVHVLGTIKVVMVCYAGLWDRLLQSQESATPAVSTT